jgi:membrane protease YdiL (CAAX protease family)
MFLFVLVSVGRFRSFKDLFQKLGFKKVALARELPLAIVYVFILFAISLAIGLVFDALGYKTDLEVVSETLKVIPLVDLLIVVTLASFVEEIFFRGFLQRKTNILFASFIFSYFHIVYGSLSEVVGTFFLGLALGKEYQQTKNLFAPIFSHYAYNLLMIALLFSGIQ